MPLPLAFGNTGVGKKLSSIREEDEDVDADDASLAILRSESRATPARSTPRSLDDAARHPRHDRAGASFASIVGKANESISALPAKSSVEDALVKSDKRNDLASNGNVLPAKPSIDNYDTIISDLKELRQQQKDVVQRMSSSQEDISTIRRDLKEIQSLFPNKSSSDDMSKSLQMVVDSLRLLTEEVKLSNAEYRESLSSLKSSSENERKALQAQISNERLVSASQRNSFEEKIEMLTKDKAQFDVGREKLDRDLKQLERSEALLEQRKNAAKGEIETAHNMMTVIRGAEARLNEELDRIHHLSEYVRQKDGEAQNKLDQAQELFSKIRDIDSSFKDAENHRMSLARERVIMLKERARERENRRTSKDIALVHRPTRLIADFSL
ncbi:hypothetical protein ACHAW5_005209 [Stephanodiscus triporus]|uniref:Uncharacterized protein n=1 Tax=Stephanodiscus triporus TaxID=2934178 RepID=A0ABD3MZX5_9STRA